MENIFHTLPAKQNARTSSVSIFSKFSAWCAGQEKYRLGWLGAILAIHGCALTPITLFAVVLTGTNFALYIATLVAMAMAVVTNLAAMPTKVTIPVFFLSVVIEIAIIILALSSGFDLASSQI
jgi:hypothetical protein